MNDILNQSLGGLLADLLGPIAGSIAGGMPAAWAALCDSAFLMMWAAAVTFIFIGALYSYEFRKAGYMAAAMAALLAWLNPVTHHAIEIAMNVALLIPGLVMVGAVVYGVHKLRQLRAEWRRDQIVEWEHDTAVTGRAVQPLGWNPDHCGSCHAQAALDGEAPLTATDVELLIHEHAGEKP